MMARLLSCLGIWLIAAAVVADDPEFLAKPGPPKPVVPWVGLSVSKLEDPIRAHAPKIPAGAGFLVSSVAAEGPSEQGGVKPYDILWKLDDQLLINEGQFAVLLAMRRPGDEVRLSVIRSGEELTMEVALGEAPEGRDAGIVPVAEMPLLPTGVPGMPRTIVFPRSRTAETTRADGSVARLHYQNDEAFVSIEGPDGKAIYDGPVRDGGKQNGALAVPEEWECQVGALLRGLHHASRTDWAPRRPRPRVVVPPAKEPQGSAGR